MVWIWNRRDYSGLYRSVGWHNNLFPFCLTLNFSVSPTHRTTFLFFSFLPFSFLNYCFRPLDSLYCYLNPLLIYLATHLLLIDMPLHILFIFFIFFNYFFFVEKNSLWRYWLLSQPSPVHTHNLKQERLTRDTQLSVSINMNLCRKLLIAHQRGLLIARLEHWSYEATHNTEILQTEPTIVDMPPHIH